MSLEQSIANLVAIGTANLELPQTISQRATQAVEDIAAAYVSRMSTLSTIFYISSSGNNNNAGTEAAPLATIGAAVSRTPIGGYCEVRLLTDYHQESYVSLNNKQLRINSAQDVLRTMTFGRSVTADGVGGFYRTLANFDLRNGAQIAFNRVRIVMPVADGTYTSALMVSRSCIVGQQSVSQSQFQACGVYYCELDFPTNNFGCLLGAGGNPSALGVQAASVIGASMLGKWTIDANASAGTATTSLPWLLTNLDKV